MKKCAFSEMSVKILDTMEAKAKEMGVTGVAAVCAIEDGNGIDWVTAMRVCGAMRTEPNEAQDGYNFVGVVYAKMCEMLDTRRDSGANVRPIIVGELGYEGGAIVAHEGGYVACAFSGGSSEQDGEISRTALAIL